MALEVTPGVLNDEVTDSVVQRHTTAALAGDRQGVCGVGDLEVSQQSTPGMGVRIGGGYGLVRGTASALQGMYSVFNDAPDETVAISPGDPSNPRNDIVGVQVQDHDFDGSTQRRARWLVVEGTPALSPVDPVSPASFLPLARVRVDQGESTSIVDGDITDLRELAGDERLAAMIANLQAGSDGAATWTPTLTSLSVGTTGGQNSARWGWTRHFSNVGLLRLQGRLQWGTAGTRTFPTAASRIHLPSGFEAATMPSGASYDTGEWRTTANRGGPFRVYPSTAASLGLMTRNVSGSLVGMADVSATSPHTWADGDSIVWAADILAIRL